MWLNSLSVLYPESVIRKTENGLTAIRDRDHSLAQKSRTLLILVDGIKTVQELVRFSSDPAQAAALLSELLTSGLVCVVEPPPKVLSVAAPARARPGETSGANASVAGAVASEPVERIMQGLVTALMKQIGPAGMKFFKQDVAKWQIDSSPTRDGIHQLINLLGSEIDDIENRNEFIKEAMKIVP